MVVYTFAGRVLVRFCMGSFLLLRRIFDNIRGIAFWWGSVAFLRQYSSSVICMRYMTCIDILCLSYIERDLYGLVEV